MLLRRSGLYIDLFSSDVTDSCSQVVIVPDASDLGMSVPAVASSDGTTFDVKQEPIVSLSPTPLIFTDPTEQ